uniref:RNA-directed DNA polymerase, eukaryota, nucleotide-binding alpha-beta plait domain protein n=1 Tax=Tanacetum cinerariifolium TaxID=118510 RepID=A0A6L2K412_TANCI|nr:RNA-directed DNA polymerase, eukaryota, nucleotide-binding alpha-beta plait domain protein [Tanacetum cinerariifolium]
MALCQSQREDHTLNWLWVVLIYGLRQTMNGILAGKEVDIGLGGGCDKALRLADMLLYSCDEGLDVYVDLIGSSPLTQTRMVDFVPGRVVIDATHHKQSVSLQTKLLRHSGIVASGVTFEDALCGFNVKMEIDHLSNPTEIDHLSNPTEIIAPKLMKKLADIHFTYTMNGRTYRCVLCYRLGVPLFYALKPCSACSRVFAGDTYDYHVVSYAGIVDFVLGRAVIDVAQRKRGKYMAKCVGIGYGFLLFFFSSLGKSEADAVTLLKRIQKFFMAQDIGGTSNEELTQKISYSIYVTNFPDLVNSRDLWRECSVYGTVVDVYIPFKNSKAGKRFAFVRFIKVFNLGRLVKNLCTLWIGRYHLFANEVRFDRPQKTSSQKSNFPSLNGKTRDPGNEGKFPSQKAGFAGFEDVNVFYLGGNWVMFEFEKGKTKVNMKKHVRVNSWFQVIQDVIQYFVSDEHVV